MNPAYFGRAWRITVTPQATQEKLEISNSNWDPNALRCTFMIEQPALSAYWYADIAIYNSAPAMSQVIQAGDLVTVEAGYQTPAAGLIFQGRVFQPLWERENNTDYKLTLHCLVGLFEDKTGYVATTIPAGESQLDAVFRVDQRTDASTNLAASMKPAWSASTANSRLRSESMSARSRQGCVVIKYAAIAVWAAKSYGRL